jgi:hypothetical protein
MRTYGKRTNGRTDATVKIEKRSRERQMAVTATAKAGWRPSTPLSWTAGSVEGAGADTPRGCVSRRKRVEAENSWIRGRDPR